MLFGTAFLRPVTYGRLQQLPSVAHAGPHPRPCLLRARSAMIANDIPNTAAPTRISEPGLIYAATLAEMPPPKPLAAKSGRAQQAAHPTNAANPAQCNRFFDLIESGTSTGSLRIHTSSDGPEWTVRFH